MDYAQLVHELRKKLLLSQAELAEKLGVSYATVNRWENGHHEPTFKQRRLIVSLCRENGVEAGEAK